MKPSAQYLSASEAAERLGISPKALRLYEQRGLLTPARTAAGWRSYSPAEMLRAGEIAALRALGLSLTQVANVLSGDQQHLEPALAVHQSALETKLCQMSETIEKVRAIRADLAGGKPPASGVLTQLLKPTMEIAAAFDLPWPWGGERFELSGLKLLNYIIGPLGSGKTRLARRIAEALPGALFVGLERFANDAAETVARLANDPALASRIEPALAWLTGEGATVSPALMALLVALEEAGSAIAVIDMVEQGLDQATQEAVITHLRRRGPDTAPLFLLTRSSAILDLAAVGADETITLCPANHSPPTRVLAYPGAPGYEAVATCLASPDVRARTEGVIAWRPEVA